MFKTNGVNNLFAGLQPDFENVENLGKALNFEIDLENLKNQRNLLWKTLRNCFARVFLVLYSSPWSLFWFASDVLLCGVSHIGMLSCLYYSMYMIFHWYCVLLLMMFYAGYLRKPFFVASEVNSQCYTSALVIFYAVWLLCCVLLPAYICPVFF